MKVILFDRTEYVIGQKAGEQLQRSLMKSNEGFVTLNGVMVRKSAIAVVKPGGYTEADLIGPNDPNRRLRSDNRSQKEQYAAARKASASVREVLEKGTYPMPPNPKPNQGRTYKNGF